MCAAAVAIGTFSAFGATAQPANSSVKNATTVRLTAPPLSILFFMNPFICLILPAQHRVYSTPSGHNRSAEVMTSNAHKKHPALSRLTMRCAYLRSDARIRFSHSANCDLVNFEH
jgi:hypothetical protein